MASSGVSSSPGTAALAAALSFSLGIAIFVGRPPVLSEDAAELRKQILERGKARQSGIASRAVDPANALRDAYSTNASETARWEEMLDHEAKNLLTELNAGKREYLPLLSDLEDPFFASDERLACSDEHAGEIKGSCNYRLEAVVQRSDEASGTIAYSRVIIHDRSGFEDIESDPACESYVRCLAKSRQGKRVRIPAQGEEFAIAQEIQSSWVDPRMYDPDFVRRLQDQYAEHLASLGPNPFFEDPTEELSYNYKKSLVPYLERHLERIEGQEG